MGTGKLLWGQPDKMLGGNLRWTSIPSRGSRNTPSRFILQKTEISADNDEPSWQVSRRNLIPCLQFVLDGIANKREKKGSLVDVFFE